MQLLGFGNTPANKKASLWKLFTALSDWVECLLHFFKTRVIDDIPEQMHWMRGCFDLRQLCLSPSKLSNEHECLRKLYDWAVTVGKVRLPEWSEICRQHELMKQRLVTAYSEEKWHKVFDASMHDTIFYGVHIMKVIFTDARFYVGCHDWLYLFNHCVLKIVNEAVVEGMGSVVDSHAIGKRGLSHDRYVKESIIDWNGPQSHECEGFLTAALNKHFKGEDWNFTSSDESLARHVSSKCSE